MGRPKKDDKKKTISLALPPYLLEWLERQPESRAMLIETALCSWYQIPEHVKAPKPVPPKIRNDKP